MSGLTITSDLTTTRSARARIAPVVIALTAWCGVALASGQHSAPGQHSASGPHEESADGGMSCPMHAGQSTEGALREPGQAVFGALREVLDRLEADAGTDWSRVDLDALRAHLVEMDLLFRDARVARETLPDGMRYTVTGGEDVLAAARSVGAMHAGMLASEEPSWQVRVEPRAADVVIEVRSTDPGQAAKIRGVGFSGLLALGDHHARHHWMLATGSGHHGAVTEHAHP